MEYDPSLATQGDYRLFLSRTARWKSIPPPTPTPSHVNSAAASNNISTDNSAESARMNQSSNGHSAKSGGNYLCFYSSHTDKTTRTGGGDLDYLSTLLFRLRYLRDWMIRPMLDEVGVTALNSLIMFTTADICDKVRYACYLSICRFSLCVGGVCSLIL